MRLSADGRLTRDEEVARWFDARRQPGDSLYVLCASAGLYANARVDPPFPYLWFDNVVQVPGARQRLEAMFTSPRPTNVRGGRTSERRTATPAASSPRRCAATTSQSAQVDGIDDL